MVIGSDRDTLVVPEHITEYILPGVGAPVGLLVVWFTFTEGLSVHMGILRDRVMPLPHEAVMFTPPANG